MSSEVRGFTLVELVVSIAIIVFITALVLVRFSAFDSTVILKSNAYDVALAIRDAQVYSISVRGSSDGYEYPYGIHFESGANTYPFFRYLSLTGTPRYESNYTLFTHTMTGSVRILDICKVTPPANEECGLQNLDISFKRPEFNAIFNDYAGSTNIITARIKVQSTKNTANTWVIEVGLLGHITVYKL